MKPTAVVICPGRGTYNKPELGYLQRHHADKLEFLASLDRCRKDNQQPSLSDLDGAERFRPALHTTGDNASALIYACAMADFLSIASERVEIVAITGNSMGWYLALAAAGACSFSEGMRIVNTMGTLMHQQAEGKQLIYPRCDDQWQHQPHLDERLKSTIERLNREPETAIFPSIDLGLMSVIAANQRGSDALLAALPREQDRYPMVLPHHAAFHSPLMQPVSDVAFDTFDASLLTVPKVPLIDGRGAIWQPYGRDTQALYEYTFGEQVCVTYNYSRAIEVACKEFAPDQLIILGPGSTLGAPTAQQLVSMQWSGIDGKAAFKQRQESHPFILSMGLEKQRSRVV